MIKKHIFITLVTGILAYAACAQTHSKHRALSGDSPKGRWGRTTPIAENKHPNLYYNQGEVEELRNMILVRRNPQRLVDLYNAWFKDVTAQPARIDDYSDHNMKAVVSYMIEPSPAKADALKTSLMSYKETWPGGLLDWYTTGGCHSCGYFVPWMFDVLLAYNKEKISSSEVAELKEWFRKSSKRLMFETRDPRAPSQSGLDTVPPVTREAKTMVSFPNWYGRYIGPALAAALLSGDQSAVDYWADSGWPHRLFTFEGVSSSYPSDSANRYDLVMYLLSVYPSGANTDTYEREGFNLENRTWNTTSYNPGSDGGVYHFAQMFGAIMGAEMAYHNGMTNVFKITDTGIDPALLRTYRRAAQSRNETDLRGDTQTGHPFIWHSSLNRIGYRRYSDPILDAIVDDIYTSSPCGMECGPEMPNPAIWEFFGYPRHVVWRPGQNK